MRLFIIGLPASGKTTLAARLSRQHSWPHLDLDALFVEQAPGSQRRVRRSLEECETMIEAVMRKESWIIEGIYPVEAAIAQADLVIWLRYHLLVSLYRQWKRFITDGSQRRNHGVIGNLKLSKFVIRLVQNETGVRVKADRAKVTVKEIEQILKRYNTKLVTLRVPWEADSVLRHHLEDAI